MTTEQEGPASAGFAKYIIPNREYQGTDHSRGPHTSTPRPQTCRQGRFKGVDDARSTLSAARRLTPTRSGAAGNVRAAEPLAMQFAG